MTFFDAIALMINEPPWSMKIDRESDPDVAMIMDFTGSFLLGPHGSRRKNDFYDPLRLTKNLIQADNWEMCERDCEWDE